MKKPTLPEAVKRPETMQLVGLALVVVGVALLGLFLSGPLLAVTLGTLAAGAVLVFIGEAVG